MILTFLRQKPLNQHIHLIHLLIRKLLNVVLRCREAGVAKNMLNECNGYIILNQDIRARVAECKQIVTMSDKTITFTIRYSHFFSGSTPQTLLLRTLPQSVDSPQ